MSCEIWGCYGSGYMPVYYGMASEKSLILSFIFWVKIQHDDLYAESMSRRNIWGCYGSGYMPVYYGMASEKSVILSFTFWVKIQHDDLYAESMSRRNMLPDLYPIHYAAVSCQTKKLHGGWS